MAGEIRQTGNALRRPFFQTVRRFKREEKRVVFNVSSSPAFPASDIIDIRQLADSSFLCVVSFMGFFGQSGVLPYFYTENLRNCLQKKDERLKRFTDFFNDRLIQLFYEIWEWSRFDIKFERYQRVCPQRKDFLCFLQNLNPLREFFYTGILSKRYLSAAGLEQVLIDHFGLPIRLCRNIPMRLVLPAKRLSQIASCVKGGFYNRLGKETVIGWKILCVESRFMIQIGPVDYREFMKLLPTEPVLHSIYDYINGIIGLRFDFRIKLLVNEVSIPFCQLQRKEKFFLGWNVFLWGARRPGVVRTVCASRMNLQRNGTSF